MKTLLLFFFIVLASSFGHTQTLLIEDPQELQALESSGLSFSELVFSIKTVNNKKLAENIIYQSLVADIHDELNDLKKEDPKLGAGMKFNHRLFDTGWLRSPSARFELVGIVNRMDRTVFNPGTCGEIRLIYRLSYEKTQDGTLINSRLPMTINTVFRLPLKTSCQVVAKSWNNVNGKTIKEWATKENLKSVELNFQATRWPSTIRGDMGGHAEYFMRVYRPLPNGALVPSTLENTPDVTLLNKNKELKEELLKWLLKPENIQALDAGTLNIPDKFLTRKVSSFALHGMNRLSNRPFDSIFKKDDFSKVDYTKLKNIYGASSFRRRLNDMTCVGCHQGRTIAGFHFLGKDPAKTIFANSIFSSQSPHMMNEISRRTKYMEKLSQGGSPDSSRPFSERDPSLVGKMNDHCGLGSEYKTWTCGTGLKCVPVIHPENNLEIGECLPDTRIAGNPCEPGTISQTTNSHKDYLKASTKMPCGGESYCQTTKVGFPGGMCSNGCDNLKSGETCGAIAELFGFNQCLARKRPFSECLAENTRPGALQACDNTIACRADYICMKTASGKGACIPPYFLFQLRVDGHPSPI
ncbi:hypothetical protein [Bdellovibrio sp. HCB-110]|uniref:hypothetical protein n=1 Tax=Bdellovibrio sp. HCB-110 TaxID=3391182 RepID=UPI0039B4A645